MRSTRQIGMLLLGAWLIAHGVLALVPLLPGLHVLLALVAIAAGVLILMGR